MAVNHNININLNGSGGTTKTSAKGAIQNINQKTQNKTKIPNILKKFNARMGGMGAVSGMKRAGVAGAIGFAVVSTANKVHDIFLDIKQASTGDEVQIGNVRNIKHAFMNPVKYATDLYYNSAILQKRYVARQNYENNYYRELTGKAIAGRQFGNKR